MPQEKSLHTQMQDLIESKQWEKAREVIDQMLPNQPDSSWLHNKMGMVMYERKDYKFAEYHLKTALYNDPSYAEALAQLAWVYFKMKRIGTADDTNKSALSLDSCYPSSWRLSFHLGMSYKDMGRAKHSLDQYQYLLPESIHLAGMHTAYCSHPLSKENFETQVHIEAHEQSLSKDPEFELAHHHLAELHLLHTKQYETAESHIKKALLLAPSNKAYKQTHNRILNKKNPILRILTAPSSFLESLQRKNNLEEFFIVLMIAIAVIIYLLA